MVNENRKSSFVTRFPVIAFVLLTFSLTWGIKLLYAFCKSKYGIPAFNFGLLASFGPFFSAFLLIAVSEGKQGIIHTLRKMSSLRIGIKWILIAALFEPLMFLAITFGYWISYREFPSSIDFLFLPSIASYLLTFFAGLFRWGVSEEIGWRGWMLPKLQIKMSPIKASLVLALFASLWHLDPSNLSTIFVSRDCDYLFGFMPEIVERLIVTIPMTMVITYIYNRTGGNLLLMMIFHSASNTSYFWVNDIFGVVETDFFRLSFTIIVVCLFIIFSYLLFKQQNIKRFAL